MRDNSDDYRRLFLQGIPLMDVRAPIEFAKGAFPGAVNAPLMNDSERQKVGACYKQQGQQAAVELGHQLVSGKIKVARVEAWKAFAQANPEGYLYCFRGGLRSQIVQQWLQEAGIQYPRVLGGYKAMRRFLVDILEKTLPNHPLILVAGLTGTGKTEVISALENSLDLEGHAHHRGSSFGRHATPQPAQIDFENRLAIEALQCLDAGYRQLVLEDEGRIVGSCNVPIGLFRAMQQAPLVWLEDSFDNRISRILADYVVDMQAEFTSLHPQDPEAAFTALSTYLLGSLMRIRKRLGGERHQQIETLMREALAEQQRSGSVEEHRRWIGALLEQYYDPMYAYQHSGKEERIIFRGDQRAVVEWLRER